jgi:MoaA/NifB/PqqE/SkfB family radical SAM enzyme
MAVQDLIMFITNRCNLKCDYCCVNANSLQEELSVGEIKEAIDIIKPTRVIHLTGGEPFLRYDDVVELAHYAWTKVPVIVINTTGTIHDIDLTKILPPDDKRQCNLIVSLDGFKENHDLHCGVENTFEKVLEFSKKAIDIGLNV